MASLLKRLSQNHQKEVKPTREELNSSNSEESDSQDVVVKQDSSDDASSNENEAATEGETINIDPENELRAFKDADPLSKDWKNRQRTLVVCSRGIAGRMRHLV